MDWIRVELKDLDGIDSFVIQTIDSNGCIFYTIVINSHLNYLQQQEAYIHEMEHIVNNDFEKARLTSVSDIEHLAHKGLSYGW